MNLSRPIRADVGCLHCHSTPQTAPASLLAIYGPDHGFGWKWNEIISAQIVSAPMQVAFDRAASVRYLFIGVYIAVLVVLVAVLNAGLAVMSRIAENVSKGMHDVPEFNGIGRDRAAGPVLRADAKEPRTGLAPAVVATSRLK
ncbi:MAG TPA: DUF3365 domain-containing protein [Methylocella sp.]|nr:DUF3365 domain-containing protein [Methylocella sp.]